MGKRLASRQNNRIQFTKKDTVVKNRPKDDRNRQFSILRTHPNRAAADRIDKIESSSTIVYGNTNPRM